MNQASYCGALLNGSAWLREAAKFGRAMRTALLASSALLAIGALPATTPLHAQTVWTGANDENWFDGTNWTTLSAPTNANDVSIDALAPFPPFPVIDGLDAQAQDLNVGINGTGMLTIQNSGTLRNRFSTLGVNRDSNGTVTVDGGGSSWVHNDLYVGFFGTGALTARDGGKVNTNGVSFVGFNPVSNGTVMVDGDGSTWTVSNDLVIGALGNSTGEMTIQNRGTVTNTNGVLGRDPGSSGTMTVDGDGSTWTSSDLLVGVEGTGALTIKDGGRVVSNGTNAIIGLNADSRGTVTIDGSGSALITPNEFVVGFDGIGILTVRNGGTVIPNGTFWIARQANSTGTVNIGAASGQPAAAPGTLTTFNVGFGPGTGNIVFNHTATDYVFAARIAGGGSVSVEAGTTTFTANSPYTGATTVKGGTLLVNGSIASSSGLTVAPGATVGGTGTLPSTTINGGTLSPGNSIGDITIAGNLSLDSASTYLVEVSPTNADRTNVNGTADLAGTVQAVFGPGSYVARQYTILSAGGLNGTFDALTTTNLPVGFASDLDYTTNDFVILNLTAMLGQQEELTGAGLPGNPLNIANAINKFFNNGGVLPSYFLPLFGLTGNNLINALNQLSGEAAAGAQSGAFQLGNQFLSLMLNPFANGRNGGFGGGLFNGGGALSLTAERSPLPPEIALAYAKLLKQPAAPAYVLPARRWSIWGGGFGGSNRTKGDPMGAGSHDITTRTGGYAAGMDYRVTPDTVLGFALGGGFTD